MNREIHVRFWEGLGVRFPRATHFAACRVWARILAQTWYAAKCPVGRWVRPRRHSEFDYRHEGYEVNYKFGT